MSILSGIPTELLGNYLGKVIDFMGGELTGSLEWKTFKAENHLTDNNSDFPERYAEALLELKKQNKPKVLQKFFIEDRVFTIIHDYWYDEERNEEKLMHSFNAMIKHFRIKEQIDDFDSKSEIDSFLKAFSNAVHKNRTAGEVEQAIGIKAILEKQGESKATTAQADPPKYLTALPSLEEEIIGREEELNSLYQTLEDSGKVVLMNGMGGIGKTTIATEYANRNKDQYQHIAWIEQLGDFATDLASKAVLVNNMNITLSGDPAVDAPQILNALSNLEGKSLLIIDNANEQVNSFKNYLPKAPDWHVLITSRQELSFTKIISLDFLSEADALKLFYSHYDLDKNDELAKKVLKTVDYHTLTIEILAKTAQDLEIESLEEIVQLLESRGIRIGKPVDLSKVAHSKEGQIKALFPYLEAIFQLGETSEEESYLLKQFIGLPPSFYTWEEITALLQISKEEEEKWDAIILARNSLRKKGWLIYNQEKKTYKMHRIIQDVLQEKLQPTYEDLKLLIKSISNLLFIDDAKDNPVNKFPFIIFGARILQVIPSEIEEDFSRFQSNLAMVYKALGDYEQARDLLVQALKSDIQNFGEEYPSTARRRSNLALVYKALGDYEQARDLLVQALKSDIQNFGEEHPSTARSRSNLALVYKALGDYEQTHDLLVQALKSVIKNFGEEHPNTARSRSNLASVYQDLGDYGQARDLLVQALKSDIKNFGEEHPNTARSRSNLALVYQGLGDYGQARDLLVKALKSVIQNFGEEHPFTAISRSNLATVYQDLGDYEQARDLLVKALKSDIKNFGEEHPFTAIRRSNLALVYKALGDYEQARDLLVKALKSDIQNFGEGHPNTAIRRSNLASVYQDLGNYGQARDLLVKALKSDIQNFGEEHPNTARSRWNLATVYINLGDKAKAKDLLQKAYNTFRSLLGEEHPYTKGSKSWLGSLE